MQILNRLASVLPAILLLALSSSAFGAEQAVPEQKFVAILIWGTDGEKPEGKELKDVDQTLKPKFANIFKWKNYYEVTRQPFTIGTGTQKDVKLSEKCLLKVQQTENEGMEVELIGEGKSVVKRKQSMPLTDILILAGDDKNKTAWFVVIKPH